MNSNYDSESSPINKELKKYKFTKKRNISKKQNYSTENNLENVYNHNMENKYCFCDQEDDGNSTMAQFFFCEDWFHKEHLNICHLK